MNASLVTKDAITDKFMVSRVVPETDIDPLIKNLLHQPSVTEVAVSRQNTVTTYKLTRSATTRARAQAKEAS